MITHGRFLILTRSTTELNFNTYNNLTVNTYLLSNKLTYWIILSFPATPISVMKLPRHLLGCLLGPICAYLLACLIRPCA